MSALLLLALHWLVPLFAPSERPEAVAFNNFSANAVDGGWNRRASHAFHYVNHQRSFGGIIVTAANARSLDSRLGHQLSHMSFLDRGGRVDVLAAQHRPSSAGFLLAGDHHGPHAIDDRRNRSAGRSGNMNQQRALSRTVAAGADFNRSQRRILHQRGRLALANGGDSRPLLR